MKFSHFNVFFLFILIRFVCSRFVCLFVDSTSHEEIVVVHFIRKIIVLIEYMCALFYRNILNVWSFWSAESLNLTKDLRNLNEKRWPADFCHLYYSWKNMSFSKAKLKRFNEGKDLRRMKGFTVRVSSCHFWGVFNRQPTNFRESQLKMTEKVKTINRS